MILCNDCRHFDSETAACNSAAAQEVAYMIWGQVSRWAHVDVAQVRLHDWACGREARWFEPK